MKDIMKKNNVFKFKYNEVELAKRFESHHCFDGTLVSNGEILIDTYWSGGGKRFTLEEVNEKGAIDFLCNLDEMDEINKNQSQYYDDVVTLFIHAGLRNKYLIKKEQPRSQTKMLESVEGRIIVKTIELNSAKYAIERLLETKLKIESGDLSVFIN